MVFRLYHVSIQPVGLVAVGINFALALVNVLTDFLVFLGAANELAKATSAAVFSPGVEPLLAYIRLSLFLYVHPKDLKSF